MILLQMSPYIIPEMFYFHCGQLASTRSTGNALDVNNSQLEILVAAKDFRCQYNA